MDLSFESDEILWILIALILFELLIIFPFKDLNPLILLTPVLILAVNLLAKKLAAPFFNLKIKYKIWEFQRYGWYERSKLKKPFPIGLVFPIAIAFFSLGLIKIPLFLQFNYKNLVNKRLLRKSGLERRSEINESDIANVSSYGFYSLLILAFLGSFTIVNFIFPKLAFYSILYGIWNLIPISQLDGSRIFFGNKLSWLILAFLYLIALFLVLI